MKDLLAHVITPQLQLIGWCALAFIGILYILSILWVIRDAYLRGTWPWLWGIIALVPFIGLIAYLILRPPLYSVDKQEQELEIALKERQLDEYGNCPKCGHTIGKDFIVCPRCDTQVRNVCQNCRRPLEPDWNVCPYCRTRMNSR